MAKVTHCICHHKSFEEIKQIAEKKKYKTVTDLRLNDVCCNGCGLCQLYVRQVLMTGKTVFNAGDYRQLV